jgi:hypothetical protein
VLSRSQSGALLERLTAFFDMWNRVEGEMATARPSAEIDGGRYRRKLVVESGEAGMESALVGEAIGAYMRAFDQSMELFFDDLDHPDRLAEQIRRLYQDYRSNSDILL